MDNKDAIIEQFQDIREKTEGFTPFEKLDRYDDAKGQ